MKRWAWLLAVCWVLVPMVVSAQTPSRIPALVYATSYHDGTAYGSAFVPPQVETIYLPADRLNVISPRQTQIYFWAITNRYVADWETQNNELRGTLIIRQGGTVVSEVPLQSYVIQYDQNDPLGTLALYTGTEADARYRAFEETRTIYGSTMSAYYAAYQAWRDQRATILANAAPGSLNESDLPDPPPEPPPFTLFSSEPRQGYPLQLSAGSYTVEMRGEDGQTVADSQKQLVLFTPNAEGVAYDVLPEQRWTRHTESNPDVSTIYAVAGTTLYLSPQRANGYNALAYGRMTEPQDVNARADRSTWVRRGPAGIAQLIVEQGGTRIAELAPSGYSVIQLPGQALGYEVVAWDAAARPAPTFSGYQLVLPDSPAAYRLYMVDEQGNVIAGSEREVRVLPTERATSTYALAALPLLVGAGLIVWRRRQTLAPRIEKMA